MCQKNIHFQNNLQINKKRHAPDATFEPAARLY